MKGIILLVDDDTDILNAYERMLTRAGYKALKSKAGKESIEIAAEFNPDIILLDVVLPDISGLDVLKELKKREDTKECFVVLISSVMKSSENQSAGLEAGADGYMLNPLGSREFIARLDAYMRHKKAIDRFRESERQKASLISNLPGMVYRCRNDQHWTMEYISEGCRELTGYGPEEIKNNSLVSYASLIDKDDRKIVWQIVQDACRSGDKFQVSYRIKDREGKDKWMYEQGSGVYTGGKLTGVEGFITDITRHRQQEVKQKFLYEVANTTMLTSDIDDLIPNIRSKLVSLLETDDLQIFLLENTEESAGSLTSLLTAQKHSMLLKKDEILKLASQGEISKDEKISEVWLGVPLFCGYEVMGAIIARDFENPDALTRESLDILEFVSSHISLALHRRKTFNDLLESKEKAEESDRLKTAFLNNLSHEIRTPLNAIMGFSDILSNDYTEKEKKQELTDLIARSGEQLLSIIDDIINISTKEAGLAKARFQNTDINSLIDNLYEQIRPSAAEKSLDFGIENRLDSDSGILFTDKTKLSQIISNLLQNAVKYTNKGCITLGAYKENNGVTIYVKDTGVGIPKGEKELIFERFRQGDSSARDVVSGMGLGLAISKSFAELIGGRLWVESEPGHGSTFYLQIPLSARN